MASPVLPMPGTKISIHPSPTLKLAKPQLGPSVSLSSFKSCLSNTRTHSPKPIHDKLSLSEGVENSVTQVNNKKLTAFRSWKDRQKRNGNLLGENIKACSQNVKSNFILLISELAKGLKAILSFLIVVLRETVIFPASSLIFLTEKFSELLTNKSKIENAWRFRKIWAKKLDRDFMHEPFSPKAKPALTLWHKKPLTLALDLDETIIHSTKTKPTNGSFDTLMIVKNDGSCQEMYVKKRPYLNEFLQKMSKEFNIVIYTASRSEYADTVIDFIDRYMVISRRFYRESCSRGADGWVKDLRKVELDLNRVVLLDNSKIAGALQPDSHLLIDSWYDDDNDDQLLKHMDFLLDCTKKWKADNSVVRDLRKYIKEFPSQSDIATNKS